MRFTCEVGNSLPVEGQADDFPFSTHAPQGEEIGSFDLGVSFGEHPSDGSLLNFVIALEPDVHGDFLHRDRRFILEDFLLVHEIDFGLSHHPFVRADIVNTGTVIKELAIGIHLLC